MRLTAGLKQITYQKSMEPPAFFFWYGNLSLFVMLNLYVLRLSYIFIYSGSQLISNSFYSSL